MHKIDSVVVKETKYIAFFILMLSLIMQTAFLVLGDWDISVLLGNVFSGVAAILNFLWMGITVQRAVVKDENDAKTTMRTSQALRTLFLFVVLAIGIAVPFFDTVATIIPLFFPRVAIALRPLIDKIRKAE